jgi:uncharacterized protein (TIGR02217 family)
MPHTNLLFSPPFLTNFAFPKKAPSFSTQVQTPKSRRGEIRYSAQPYPIWTWEWVVNFLRGGEQVANSDYQYLLGFFLSMGGMLSDFLLQDAYDNTIANCFFGLGDGATTQFQLTRTIGLGTDIVQSVNGVPTIFVNGSATSAFTIGTTGIVTFTSAPAASAILAWSGSYYYRARFDTDSLDFEQFMDQLFSVGSLKLTSVIL